jgi:FkbM family methyltransferase
MSLTITPHWQNAIWYETDVLLALLDLTAPGDIVLDIGAHVGGISSMLSPKVGPFGKIIAFEASPRTIGILHSNMAGIHATNVHIVHAAVSDENNSYLPFYYGHIPNADSLMDKTGDGTANYVKSISLDAWLYDNGVVPDLVKMDIEGAEYRAINGFLKTIEDRRLPMVLEVGYNADQPHKLLTSLGYEAINLATYEAFAPNAGVSGDANVLYIHPESAKGRQYRNARLEVLHEVGMDELVENGISDNSLPLGQLEPGRYVFVFLQKEATATTDDIIEIAVGVPNQLLSLRIASVSFLTKSPLRMSVQVDRLSPAYALLKRIDRDKLMTLFSGIRITRVMFDGASNPV